ncbi:hypothetical protein GGR56DRAFT_563650 [Xylariaceae sp. FL0804]|nr:hypothetical protein GGR56DRAFT_563650 [Xylariaceae sp. FL0804]
MARMRMRSAGAPEIVCTFPQPIKPVATTPIAGHYDFHQLSAIVSGACAAFTVATMLVLMYRHATTMSRPREQIPILRVCLFVPVYAVATWIMVIAPRAYVYLLACVVVYEAYALACFYLLVCEILLARDGDDDGGGGGVGAGVGDVDGGWTRARMGRSGSGKDDGRRRATADVFLAPLKSHARRKGRFGAAEGAGVIARFFAPRNRFLRHWVEIFQCVPVTLALLAATAATQATRRYCLTASSAGFAHLYLVVVQIVSMVGAVVGVVHTYAPLRRELRGHRVMARLWAFKLFIFLGVGQNLAFSILEHVDPPSIADSAALSQVDVVIGLPLLILSCELVFFALFFHYAYAVAPYRLDAATLRAGERYATHGWRMWLDVLNPSDVIAATLFTFRLRREISRLEAAAAHQQQQLQLQQPEAPGEEGAGGDNTELRRAPPPPGMMKGANGGEADVMVGWAELPR